ncbi:hypothetical protein ACV3R4_15465 [Clostridium perfringens]|uniref:hypothetical protein n=1 Tax=Clostridium perfringens TaxID=1502 RepID=UPI0018E44777|nr:hypothetical protein [Clostridium perfringens]MBI6112019.1 hypothetical protein [Clostridium perfringens]MBI6115063.1 hypothetical protein [Clostridium perfringens]MDM0633673.1 hypothetical protein [Clostridium perfringens]MDM0701843.1 hypothetical protein [Clostridium perfringens]MDO6338385.1 hypothetical protein [Clostridium perfringens]
MNDLIRTNILAFLQWNDKNGYYTDERCDFEEVQKLSLEESIKYFFGVINSDFYYSIADNIFELSFYEIIKYAKDYKFYNQTYKKLKLLINSNPNEILYRNLLE